MRKLCVVLVAIALLLLMSFPAAAAGEWTRYNQAEQLTQQENWQEALPLWEQLAVDMQQIGQPEAAGFAAQNAGRILDRMGQYQEAVGYYNLEARLWDALPRPGQEKWSEVDKSRALTLNPVIGLFVEKPFTTASGGKLGKFEPANGIVFGATTLEDPAIGNRKQFQEIVAAKFGKPYSGILAYVNWGDLPSSAPELQQAAAAKVLLQMAWQLTGGLEAVADDAYLRRFASELKTYGQPVLLRFGGEMNGDWVVWGGNPQLYKEKFRLVTAVMRQEAPNVAMVWAPNYIPAETVDSYYPGDEWVDWVGINAYTDYYCNGDPAMDPATAAVFFQGKEANPLNKFQAIYDRYSPRKPVLIGETGIAWANRTPYLEVPDWARQNLRRFYGYLPLAFPRIKAAFYFNADLRGKSAAAGFSHYLVSGRPLLEQAIREAITSPLYLNDYTSAAPVTYNPAEYLPTAGALACYIPSGPIVPSRVVYQFNGQPIGSATAPPWRVDYQGLPGDGELEVIAFDPAGIRLLSSSWTIRGGRVGAAASATRASDEIRILLNDQPLVSDVPPIILNSRTLVPIRAISEALGATVTWEPASQTITLRTEGKLIALRIGDSRAIRNGQTIKLDLPAQIIDNRTMVPLRFVSESLNTQVSWDSTTRTIRIVSE